MSIITPPNRFHLTPDQYKGLDLLGGDQTHTMLFGGSRSGKTFLIVRTIIYRALRVVSRHLMARFRLVDIEGSIVADTFPKVMELCYPESVGEVRQRDRYFEFPNGSEVWWAGLDDKERTEKILGKEYATTFLNECSQIPWMSRNMVMTRLAQKTSRPNPDDPTGELGLPLLPGLRLKAFYDENPPLKTHWSYQVFIQKMSPDTNRALGDPSNFNSMLMNPEGNKENLDPQYLAELDALPERMKKRFKLGQFGEPGEGALWTEELLEQQRVDNDGDLPEMQRIVIGVDPSGARDITDITRDEIGIIVAGLGVDGKGYVLDDLTVRGAPELWGRIVVQAYRRYGADRVVAETNFGGAMVASVIKAAAAALALEEGIEVKIAFTEVTASRGKVVRAEPISTLYEGGMVFHVAGLMHLEAEMTNMSIAGYLGDRSPNRVDAAVWALTALFHAVTKSANKDGSRGNAPPVVNRGYADIKQTMGRSNVGRPLPRVNRGR